MPETMTAPLSIWTTGAPVPTAQRARGSFFDMIHRHTRSAFPGAHHSLQAVELNSRAAVDKLVKQEMSGVIVTGSAAHLRHAEEWMKWTMEALIQLDKAGVPILGICFGHQLLGEAMGGTVDYNPRGREIGTFPLTFHADDPLLRGPQAKPVVVMTHLDSVITVPSHVERLGSTPLEPNAALRFSETTWGVQFHPEMDVEIVGCYLSERVETIRAEGIDVEGVEQRFEDSPYGAQLLAHFAAFCANRRRFA